MVHNEKYKTVAIYSRVSMSDQDASRQLTSSRLRRAGVPCAEIVEFIDIISGTATNEAENYQTLRSEVADNVLFAEASDRLAAASVESERTDGTVSSAVSGYRVVVASLQWSPRRVEGYSKASCDDSSLLAKVEFVVAPERTSPAQVFFDVLSEHLSGFRGLWFRAFQRWTTSLRRSVPLHLFRDDRFPRRVQ